MNAAKEIRIDTDKNGKKAAYYFSRNAFRWFRMKIAEAELLIATCSAKSVTYGPDFTKYGAAIMHTEKQGGMTIIHSSYYI